MTASLDVSDLHSDDVIRGKRVDATAHRERNRRKRVFKLAVCVLTPIAWLLQREFSGHPVRPGIPQFFKDHPEMGIMMVLLLLIIAMVIMPYVGAGKSPHTVLYPGDSSIRLSDVVGAKQTRREAIDTLNLFLSHQTFADELGGSARRGVLFEGPPGTGKTYLAKALAAEAGVPFLFVSASEFQSMFYGQTNRKVRTFFKSMRKLARKEGGAIGFIEEFDAIGGARSGMNTGSMREGIVGVVNELLVQMQSFDLPMGWEKVRNRFVGMVNNFLPPHRALKRKPPVTANVLVIAATNRAADLDPALLRPGRFDRVIHFGLPPHSDRMEIAGYYLDRKAHDDEVTAQMIADLTPAYTPVRIERLLDEALIVALRHGRRAMTRSDVVEAQLAAEVGLSQDAGYHPDERRRIAVHEAGHALTATLAGRDIKIASILRRSEALGLVAHQSFEERFLTTPTEARDLIVIALAGRAAERMMYGEASSGIAADLQAATTLAARLVGTFGAADSLISLDAAALPGAGNTVAKVLADRPSRNKVDRILNEAAVVAEVQLAEHRDALLRIADALCAHDELTGRQIARLVKPAADALAHARPQESALLAAASIDETSAPVTAVIEPSDDPAA